MGSANKTKKQGLESQAKSSAALSGTLSNWANQDRSRNEADANRISSEYWNLYGGVGADGGSGGAGPVQTYSNPFWKQMQEGSLDQYQPMQHGLGNTWDKMVGKFGLFGEGGYNDVLRQGASNAAAQFGGLRRSLENAGLIRGGAGPGMGEQGLALAATGARVGNQGVLDSRINLMKEIAGQQERGSVYGAEGAEKALGMRASGAKEYDTQEQKRVNAINSANAAAAGRPEDELRQRLAILGELRGLRGEGGSELGYTSQAMGGHGQAGGMYAAMPEEKPWWQQALGAAIPLATTALTGGVGGIAMGSAGGILGKIAKKKPTAAPAPNPGIWT